MRPSRAPSFAATGRLCAPRQSRSDNASRNVARLGNRRTFSAAGLDGVGDVGKRQQPKGALAAANQPLDEPGRGLGQELGRRRILQQAATVHHGDAVAKLDRLLHIVRHQHDGDAQAALQRQQILAAPSPG